MLVVGPYCQQEGMTGVIRQKDALADPERNRGIWLDHGRTPEEALRARPR
jgi:hypothetical protein